MSAVILDLADAVVASINAAGLSPTFTATRDYVPVRDLDAATTLWVRVIPVALRRNTWDYAPRIAFEPIIGVWIQQRISAASDADPLVLLAESIGDLFQGKHLTAAPAAATNARCIGVEQRPVFDPDAFDEKSVYTTTVYLTFRLTR